MERIFRKKEIPDDLLEYFEEVTPKTEPCVVCDPFAGSCTTAIVSHKHGRKFVGIELSEDYLENIAVPRIEKATEQLKLFN